MDSRNIELEKFIFKAFDASDDAIVDDKGRYIIFRNVNGHVVPIHTDAADFAEHLRQNGVDVDPSDRDFLDDLDKQLEEISRLKETDPKLSFKYSEALEKKIKLMSGYHQKKMDTAHGEKSPEKQKELQELLTANEDKVIRRQNLPNKGWNDYLRQYVANSLKNYEPDSKAGMVLAAYGVILQHGLKHAITGTHATQMSFSRMLDEISDDYMQTSNIDAINNANGLPSHQNRVKIAQGARILKAAVAANLPVAKNLEKSFNESYASMNEDFNNSSSANPLGIEEIKLPQGRTNTIPDTLPPMLGERELAALQALFKDSSSKQGVDLFRRTHKVADHIISRLIDTFPSGVDRFTQQALTKDLKNRMVNLHRKGFETAISYDDPMLHSSTESIFSSIMSEALTAVQTGTETAFLSAIQKIALKLGEMDGYRAKAEKPTGRDADYIKMWKDGAVGSYRTGGSPSLESLITSSDARKKGVFDNHVLKIPWRPSATKTPQKPVSIKEDELSGNTDFVASIAPVPTKPKLVREGNQIKTPDGEFFVERQGDRVVLKQARDNSAISSIPVGDNVEGIIEKLSTKIPEQKKPTEETTFDLDFPEDETKKGLEEINHNHEVYEDFFKTSPSELKTSDGWIIKAHLDDYGVASMSLYNNKGALVSTERVSDEENVGKLHERTKTKVLRKLSNLRTDSLFPIRNIVDFFDYSDSPDYSKIREFHSWLSSGNGIGLSSKKISHNLIKITNRNTNKDTFFGLGIGGKGLFSKGMSKEEKPTPIEDIEKFKLSLISENNETFYNPEEKPRMARSSDFEDDGEKVFTSDDGKTVSYGGTSIRLKHLDTARELIKNYDLLKFTTVFNIDYGENPENPETLSFSDKKGKPVLEISRSEYNQAKTPQEKEVYLQKVLNGSGVQFKKPEDTQNFLAYLKLVAANGFMFNGYKPKLKS